MVLNKLLLKETNERTLESAEQHQTACMCSLVLHYTLQLKSMVENGRKRVNPLSHNPHF